MAEVLGIAGYDHEITRRRNSSDTGICHPRMMSRRDCLGFQSASESCSRSIGYDNSVVIGRDKTSKPNPERCSFRRRTFVLEQGNSLLDLVDGHDGQKQLAIAIHSFQPVKKSGGCLDSRRREHRNNVGIEQETAHRSTSRDGS